jgi:RNA-directed DNA polymerase
VGKPETSAYLGFTHICGKSRRGVFQLRRKTRRDRMRAKLAAITPELRRHLHASIPEQGSWLRRVMTGCSAYYPVPINSQPLSTFRYIVSQLWLRTLRRRSQRTAVTW